MDSLYRILGTCLAAFLLTLTMPGCTAPSHEGDDDDNDDSATGDDDAADDDAADDDTVAAEAMVSGRAGREFSTCPPAGNGVGDLCLYLLTDCADPFSDVASTVVPDADMSWPDNLVDFTIEGVPDGVWQLYGFLDDDGSGCEGGVSNGDFYLADECVEVEVVDQQDVTGVLIKFNSKCSV